MSTVAAGDVLAARMAQFKHKQEDLAETAAYFVPQIQPIIIKPIAPRWEELEQVINLPGLWITVRELYDRATALS
jgi:hypothetical protein